jgi:hypothetical protein
MHIREVIDLNDFLDTEDFMRNVAVTGCDPYNSHDAVIREAALCAPAYKLDRVDVERLARIVG